MRKKKLIRINKELQERLNVASQLPYESIIGSGDRKYQDKLVSGGYHNFMDNYSRREVALNDAIGERVTLGFLKHVFEKLPKFCANDEIIPQYIMEDVRDAIDTLNLKPKFISIGTNAVMNGWCLVKWGLDNMRLTCKIFGYEECHPRFWRRFMQPSKVNLISHYRAIYIPRPAGMEATYHIFNEERYILYPQDPELQHLTRIDRNYGLGYSRIQPIWDAITKLRERSDSEHFLKSNFMEARYPQSWTTGGKAKAFIDKVRRATRRRGLAVEAVTNPQTNEDTGLPSVQYRPWAQGPQGKAYDINKGGAYLDGEWLRLLANLGYSQEWASGMAGGASGRESGEVNLTRDDRADIAEFSVLEPIFKDILKRLAILGVMSVIGVSQESIELLISKKYKMVSWLTWEYNDRAQLQQEQIDHQLEMKRSEEGGRNAYDRENVDYGKIVGMTKEECPRCGDWGRKTIYQTGDLKRARCPNCGHSWEIKDNERKNSKTISDYISCCMKDHPEYGQKKCVAIAYNKFGKSNSTVEAILLHCIRNNASMPMTPVMSSWIKSIGYDEGSLYMEVHDPTKKGITTYEYNPGDPEAHYMDWVDSGSKGGYWWDYIRDVYSPAFKHGKPPAYLETGYGEGLEWTEAEKTREFKIEGEPKKGLIGAGYTREPFRIDVSKVKPKEEEKPAGFYPAEFEPYYEYATPTVPEEPYKPPKWQPYNPTYNEKFNEVLNSASALRRFAANISTEHAPEGWHMRQDSPYRIKELVEELMKASIRLNRVSFGNSIKAGHPYNYGGEDEFICPKDYKQNIGKKVPLGIYHNLDIPGDPTLPEWQQIGWHEVLGWDDELGQEIAKNEYDEEKINAFFEKHNEENWIKPYLDAGQEPPISGAYTCNVKKYNGKNFQVNIDLKSMSFVPDANCPWDICNFKPQLETVKT